MQVTDYFYLAVPLKTWKTSATFARVYESYHNILRQNNHQTKSRNRKRRKESENNSREQHISRSAKHNKSQSKHKKSLLKTTQT